MGAEQRKKSVAEHPPTLLGGTAIRPVERHGFEKIRYIIYNPETGEVLSRTPKSWFLITVFYCIYYTCLAAFWYGMLTLVMSFIPVRWPMHTLDDSLIGTNPGIGMRPHQNDKQIDSSMLFLTYDGKDAAYAFPEGTRNIDWAKRYELFLDEYKDEKTLKDLVECPSDRGVESDVEKAADRKACIFDVETLGECGPAGEEPNKYGYINEIEPCVLLKVNRIYGWRPTKFSEEYSKKVIDDPEVPQRVKDIISENNTEVFVHCEGENPADREALVDDKGSKIEYFPKNQAFPIKYFPFTQGGEGRSYHSPLVGIKLRRLPKGQLVHIECKLWAEGMTHYNRDRIGLVHMEVILEMNSEAREAQKQEEMAMRNEAE